MGMEIKVTIGEEHNSNIDFDSLDKINKEYQEAKREEEKATTSNSDTSSGKVRSINLFDDDILQKVSVMLDYLNMEEDRKHERK